MKRSERVAAAFFLVLGLGAAAMALPMGYGSARFPGPGYLPFWLAALLAATSAIYLGTVLGRDPAPAPLWARGAWVRPAIAGAVMLAFSLLMAWLGFFAATFLLFVGWLVLVERARWATTAAVSVLGTLGAYLLFAVLLQVPLPKGLLF